MSRTRDICDLALRHEFLALRLEGNDVGGTVVAQTLREGTNNAKNMLAHSQIEYMGYAEVPIWARSGRDLGDLLIDLILFALFLCGCFDRGIFFEFWRAVFGFSSDQLEWCPFNSSRLAVSAAQHFGSIYVPVSLTCRFL
eukprot:1262972-Amorphochlora_amoeboformis.AAC.1